MLMNHGARPLRSWHPIVRPRRRWRNGDEEAGVVLVIYTLAIVAVLLFAALAVDLGNIAQTKQHAQDAADAAALSAVWDLTPIVNGGSSLTAASEATAVTDVDNYLQHNYPSVQTPLTSTSCAPGSLPALATQSSQTDCVGFYPATAPNTIVVVIPAQNVNYSFGRVGGNTSQAVSAIAEASLSSTTGNHELPYAFCLDFSQTPPTNCGSTATTQTAGLFCLKTSSNGSCPGANIGPGDFGEVFSPRYQIYPSNGNPTGGGNDPIMMADIALGLDHTLVTSPDPTNNADNICDYNPPGSLQGTCPAFNNTFPYDTGNAVVTATGQNINEAGPALYNPALANGKFNLDGCPFTVPRLNHGPGFQPSGTCSVDNPAGGFTTTTCPCLAPGDTFGYTPATGNQLNGVHISDYLLQCLGDTDGDNTAPSNADGSYDADGDNDCATPTLGTQTQSHLYTKCYQSQGPPDEPSPSPTGDAIDKTTPQSGGSTVWSYTSTTEDTCLSNEIQKLANDAACTSTPLPPQCQIFATAISESPRFGTVPIVAPVTGKKGDAIIGFDDVFIYDATGPNNNVATITAWVFPPWMVQTGPGGGPPGGPTKPGPLTANLCSLTASPGPNC